MFVYAVKLLSNLSFVFTSIVMFPSVFVVSVRFFKKRLRTGWNIVIWFVPCRLGAAAGGRIYL